MAHSRHAAVCEKSLMEEVWDPDSIARGGFPSLTRVQSPGSKAGLGAVVPSKCPLCVSIGQPFVISQLFRIIQDLFSRPPITISSLPLPTASDCFSVTLLEKVQISVLLHHQVTCWVTEEIKIWLHSG